MSERGNARRGKPGAARIKPGLSGQVSASIISAPDTTSPLVFVGAADSRRRAWLIDLGRIAAAALPASAVLRVKAAWAAILDNELGGRR